MNGKHTHTHKLINVFKIAWLQQKNAETDMDFTQEKFRTKPCLCCWIQQPNTMEKAAASLYSHGQQTAHISNKHRHTDNYSTNNCQTHKSTYIKIPASPNGFILFPILVDWCIMHWGSLQQLNLGTILPAASDPAAAGHANSSGSPESL